MTLDCKKLLLGINGPPKVAITPNSLGEEVFKKASWDILVMYSANK